MNRLPVPMYEYGGYQGRRGGYNMHSTAGYGATRPNIQQYESFFNPIPIEFLQQEFGKRQDRYDTSYAGALAARDELANVQVDMQDMADKNRLIQSSVDDINSTIDEKYQGDWGRAAKDIASKISKVRGNEFWNAQAEMQKKRDLARELKIKYGPDAMIFNDPSMMSTLDEQGNVRDYRNLEPDIIQKGDWSKTARELMSGLTADQRQAFGLTDAEVEGYLKTGNVSEITRTKIEEMAKDPAIIDAFLSQHGEIRRGFQEGNEQLRSQFGFDTTPEDFARRQLLGAGASKKVSQAQTKYLTDHLGNAARKAAMEEQARGREPQTTPDRIITNAYQQTYETVNPDRFDQDGNYITPDQRKEIDVVSPKSLEPLFKPYGLDPGVLLARGWDKFRELYKEKEELLPVPLTIPGAVIKYNDQAADFVKRLQQHNDKIKIEKLRETFPDMEGYTDGQLNNMVQSATEKLGKESSTLHDYDDDWQEPVTESLVWNGKTWGDMFNRTLYVNGELVSGDKKQKLFAKSLGYNDANNEEFEDALKESRVSSMAYTGNIPGAHIMKIRDKDGKMNTVEISPSDQMIEYSTPSWLISEYVRSNGKSPRLGDYQVGELGGIQINEDGTAYVPTGKFVTLEDGSSFYTFYEIDSELTPTNDNNTEGQFSTNIRRFFIDPEGNKRVIPDESITMEDVLRADREKSEKILKEKKNQQII